MSEFIPIRAEVQAFAQDMERKLSANDHKQHWSTIPQDKLLRRLKQELRELERAMKKGKNVVEEAADVANFAMMIADNEPPDGEKL